MKNIHSKRRIINTSKQNKKTFYQKRQNRLKNPPKSKINPKYQKYIKIVKPIIKILLFFIFMLIYYYTEYIFLPDLCQQQEIILDINELNNLDTNITKLTNVIDNTTIVTSYFKIRSKHYSWQYARWHSNFLRINHPMVFFIDINHYKKIIHKRPIKYRNKTIWIKTNISDFNSYKYFYEDFKNSYKIDFENQLHNPLLYMIWAEKINFLKIAGEKNFFHSKCFYWVDSGCFRKGYIMKNFIEDWPSPEECLNDGRILMNQKKEHSEEFKKKIIEFDIDTHIRLQKSFSVDASIFGGEKKYIYKFYDLYYDTLKKYLEHGIFIGKDQNIYAYIAYTNPDLFKLVCYKYFFGLQKYLHKDKKFKEIE